jgi:hypothetical protein
MAELDNDVMWLLFCRWKPMLDEMYAEWLAEQQAKTATPPPRRIMVLRRPTA